MNIVFWLLIVIVGLCLWFSLSGLFYGIGKGTKEIKDNIFKDKEENKK